MAGQFVFLPPLIGEVDSDIATPVTFPTWVRTVDAGEVWRFNCVGIDLVTAGVAGNRYVAVELRNALGQIVLQTAQQVIQTANQTRRYHFQLLGATSTAFWAMGGGGAVQLSHPLPEHYIEPAGSLQVVVVGNQAGDAFANYGAYLQKWRV